MHLDSGNDSRERAMELALKWLTVRGRSRVQIEARLRQAGFSDEIAARVSRRLTELGILDDRAFALAGAQTGLRRGLARGYLQHQLEGKGVDASDAAWALEETGNGDSDAVRARQLADTWVRSHPSETGVRGLRRLGSLLVRRGYDEELAVDVCRQALGDPHEVEGEVD